MPNLKTPVVFIIFNRPDVTRKTFQAIRSAKPKKLLLIADGPRPERIGEVDKCIETRKILEGVDWDCEVIRCFSETNLGCKERVSSGITWAFEQVEEAIILEDDCLPDLSFFPYCDELLAKYRDNSNVMAICGSSFIESDISTNESYYMSRLPIIWGWASWRRAWKKYDLKMTEWPRYRDSKKFRDTLPSFAAQLHYRNQMNRTYKGKIDTWDYQWMFALWDSNGLCVIPTKNLVRNIGFGPEATHTLFYDPSYDSPVSSMEFPLIHPSTGVEVNGAFDKIWLKKHHNLFKKVKRRIHEWKYRLCGSTR